MSCKDVLAAGLLATFHHEMGISAGAAPLTFNAFGVGASADDSVSISGSGGIKHHPHIVSDVAGMAHVCLVGTLLSLPGIKHLTAHEARATLSADDHAVLENIEHSDAQGILSLLADAEVRRDCHGNYRDGDSREPNGKAMAM